MSFVLDFLRSAVEQGGPDVEPESPTPGGQDFGSNTSAQETLQQRRFTGGGGYVWQMGQDGSWTCVASPDGRGVGNTYAPGDPVHDVISQQYRDATGQELPSSGGAAPQAVAHEVIEEEAQEAGGWGVWWQETVEDVSESADELLEDVQEFAVGVSDWLRDNIPTIGGGQEPEQEREQEPEQEQPEPEQEEDVELEPVEHYAIVTDGRSYLREGPPGFASTGETIPLETRVYLRETAWVAGRYTGYARVETVEGGEELGWTSMGNLTSNKDINDAWVPDAALDLTGLSGTQRRMAELYNEKGALLESEATRLGITAGQAAATMMAESGGRGYNADGRMIIRFENHRFYSDWGRANREVYAQHFRYNTNDRDGDGRREVWLGHEWRENAEDSWQDVHASQDMEWQVLEFAQSLGNGAEEAAAGAISMGAGQTMGRDWHEAFGYDSAVEMLEDMQENPESNIGGIFSFIENNETARQALLDEDYVAFARQYNGPGKAAEYGGIISNYVAAWDAVMARQADGPDSDG
ncbi:MAG: N-acetylmuramidase domain-containing protein [Myxococcota bacterium]